MESSSETYSRPHKRYYWYPGVSAAAVQFQRVINRRQDAGAAGMHDKGLRAGRPSPIDEGANRRTQCDGDFAGQRHRKARVPPIHLEVTGPAELVDDLNPLVGPVAAELRRWPGDGGAVR